jgi:Uma2 family endonuclease
VSPAPSTRHQRVVRNLVVALTNWVRQQRVGQIWCAPCDILLAPTTIVQPDVVYVSTARAGIVQERGIEAAPDLVIEILSDSTAARDLGVKMQLYARYGVRRYWIVDAMQNTLDVYVLRDSAYQREAQYRGEEILRVDVPEGFEISLAELWRED